MSSLAQARPFSAKPGWAVGCAAVSVAAFIGALALLFSNAYYLPWAGPTHLILSGFVGPLAATISAVVLLRRAGRLPARVALFTSAGAVPAWALAVTTAASWSVRFDEADTGQGFGWFGSSMLVFMILGWIAGTVCLAVPFGSLLASQRSLPIRVLQAVLLAAPTALILGALMLMPPMVGALGSVVLLIVALRQEGPAPSQATAVVAGGPAVQLKLRTVAVAAFALLIVGLACAAFALTGSSWAPAVTDATHAMNLGLAFGAFAGIPVLMLAGRVLASRLGTTTPWAILLGCAGLATEGAAQLLGAGHPSQWPVVVAAAALMGFAIALPFGRLVAGGVYARIGVIMVVGLAASSVGLPLVAVSAFLAPLGSGILLVWAWRSGRAERQPRHR
ncbi:hypothetical protein [Paenarthrobacter aurescens]|uniref:hypothetical protein n=1 Tax=Paenarthrobacter aurescens TaxID=43663 RepID=UPI0021C2403A|nr:hypothetical protein [Paenarthrobacter aurescens]MCT9869134.1 hypothetical protein [Paenarthrobacter aurescens]